MKMTPPPFLRQTQAFARSGGAAVDTNLQRPGKTVSAPALAAADRYRVELVTHRSHDPAFCALWRELVAASKSPQQIFQTPAFFKFLLDSRAPGTRAELLALVRQSDGAIEGVVPVIIAEQVLSFAIGKLVLFAPRIPMVRLLGSIPALPPDIGVVEHVAHQILARFPDARSIFMQALPAGSEYRRTLEKIGAGQRGLATSLMGGWRDCHTMPLPASFEEYLAKFSAKKRYNLNRQVRRLEEQAGTLDLARIEHTGQVGHMLQSLAELVSPAEFAATVNPRTLAHLAAQGLLCCYVLRAGGESVAVIIGRRAANVLHIDKIFVTEKHRALSVGTSAMHLAVKDVIGQGGVSLIDFGYGTPKHDFSSSQVLESRGQMLLFDSTTNINILLRAHSMFFHAAEALVRTAKHVMEKAAAAMRR
jgi:CelD/BcsL family acetyltransferase involved in cellulose biosynthesis